MRRKRKKSRKLLGQRTHGKGNTKNRRGSGNRGGVGSAGFFGHKFSYMLKYHPEAFSRKGFQPPRKTSIPTINLFEIENLIKKGKLSAQDGKYSFYFEGKILGEGTISYPVIVKAHAASKSAEEKIKKAGGEFQKSI
ncbi:MAG: uL15m family ribosomal protein [Candidatus Anstonellales archaeon]